MEFMVYLYIRTSFPFPFVYGYVCFSKLKNHKFSIENTFCKVLLSRFRKVNSASHTCCLHKQIPQISVKQISSVYYIQFNS